MIRNPYLAGTPGYRITERLLTVNDVAKNGLDEKQLESIVDDVLIVVGTVASDMLDRERRNTSRALQERDMAREVIRKVQDAVWGVSVR